jgi:argonaute-like protein implicated in RNA metabolism and viral defense
MRSKKGLPSNYPAHRGTSLQLDGRTTLLWTQGNAPSAVGGKDSYKEGKGNPSPLMLRRFAGHGTWDSQSEAVLGLTKMNWNNDALYDRLPVTLAYAQVLARVVKRMPRLLPQPYQFRYFI